MTLLAGVLAAAAVLVAFWPGLQARVWGSPWATLRWHAPGEDTRSGLARLIASLGSAETDRLCRQAGRPFGLTGRNFVTVQWVVAGATFFIAAGSSIGFGIFLGTFGWYAARLFLKAAADNRHKRLELELPTFLDLWGLLVGAGESVEGALVEVVQHHPDWLLSGEMRVILARVASSGLLGESLLDGARETGSAELTAVAEQVRQLLEGGGTPSKELARVAERLRHERMAHMVQATGMAAVVGIFPKLFGVFLSLTPVLACIMLTVLRQL